jgi:ankyrin repeat protein
VALLLPAVNDLNSRDLLGRTALHLAAESGHSDIVVMLLEERRHFNRHNDQVANVNAQDCEGRSALHLAINGNCCSTIAVLVKNQDIDMELKDDAGLTPLHQSIIAGHEEIVKLLIANGADLNVKIG